MGGSLRRAERAGNAPKRNYVPPIGTPFSGIAPGVETPLTPRLPTHYTRWPLKTSCPSTEMTSGGSLFEAHAQKCHEVSRPGLYPSHALEREGQAGLLSHTGCHPLHVPGRPSGAGCPGSSLAQRLPGT